MARRRLTRVARRARGRLAPVLTTGEPRGASLLVDGRTHWGALTVKSSRAFMTVPVATVGDRAARGILVACGRMSEDAGDWLLISLDEKLAKKQGVPARIPVPKGEFESLADKGMTVDQMRAWVSKFITTSPAMHNANWRTQNAALARSFEVFVAKKDSWAKAQDGVRARTTSRPPPARSG